MYYLGDGVRHVDTIFSFPNRGVSDRVPQTVFKNESNKRRAYVENVDQRPECQYHENDNQSCVHGPRCARLFLIQQETIGLQGMARFGSDVMQVRANVGEKSDSIFARSEYVPLCVCMYYTQFEHI